jgi:hypothetical protein
MPHPQPAATGHQLPRGHLLVLNRSFRRTLEAENKSLRTIEAYTDAVRLLASYCQAHGQPLLAGELRREHIQAFIADQLARWKPATAHNRYRGLHAFFKWAVAEGDLAANPMDGMSHRSCPSNRSTWSGPSTWRCCSKTCQGRDFTSRRGNENELMLVAGWKSRTMIDRYTKATAVSVLGQAMPADRRQISCRLGSSERASGDSCRRLAARVIAGRAPGVIIGHPSDPRRSQPPAFAGRRRGLGAVAGAQLGDR